MARTISRDTASPISAIFFFTGVILLVVGFLAAAFYGSLPLLAGTTGVVLVIFVAAAILARLGNSHARESGVSPPEEVVRPEAQDSEWKERQQQDHRSGEKRSPPPPPP